MVSDPRIIVALDYESAEEAQALVSVLDPTKCRLKIGKELFTRSGPETVRRFQEAGFDVFLDLKFHDIPNTVAKACAAAAELGVWMVNVHASGGREMMEAARDALDEAPRRPLLIAVTVLTSLSGDDLKEVGISSEAEQQVLKLASLAQLSGLDGVVCSAREVEILRKELDSSFKLVTPGIRPAGSAQDDQKRVVTPAQAIQRGSDYIVIGRPITRSPDPLASLLAIDSEISGTL